MSTYEFICLVSDTDYIENLRADIREGFSARPYEIPPRWFYDDRGSQLFDQITRLPEYYPTRTERSILQQYAGEIARVTQPTVFVELGSGTSEKTRLLIEAMLHQGSLATFVPFDISKEILEIAAADLSQTYPMQVHAIVGDFRYHLEHLPEGSPRVLALLGGTIGNFLPPDRMKFLNDVRMQSRSGDAIIIGTDLVKDRARLLAAYNDSSGVTAEFNKNVLTVVNRELNANFDSASFLHVARFLEEDSCIEMALRAVSDQRIAISALDLEVHCLPDEEIRTEISTKFTIEGFRRELIECGFSDIRVWADPAEDFAVWVARP